MANTDEIKLMIYPDTEVNDIGATIVIGEYPLDLLRVDPDTADANTVLRLTGADDGAVVRFEEPDLGGAEFTQAVITDYTGPGLSTPVAEVEYVTTRWCTPLRSRTGIEVAMYFHDLDEAVAFHRYIVANLPALLAGR